MFGHSFSTVWENKLLRGSIRESRGSEFELNDRAEDDHALFCTRATPFVKIDEDSDDRKNSNSSSSGKKQHLVSRAELNSEDEAHVNPFSRSGDFEEEEGCNIEEEKCDSHASLSESLIARRIGEHEGGFKFAKHSFVSSDQ
jgi:hypothetical protein